jgi:iron-sulfur cluster repair protein YtfE (RIC family)
MNKSINIFKLMVKNHRKIEDLLNNLEGKNNEDFNSMHNAFNKLEWELEKHIFTEEKAIFTSYNPEDKTEGYKMLPELTKQHNFILNKLNNWRKDIRNKRNISDFYSFKVYLTRHKTYEEEKVYPILDQSITDDEKIKIAVKINEIVQK